MTAIPVLIVAPAIIAAGVTYRYMGRERRRRGQREERGEATSTRGGDHAPGQPQPQHMQRAGLQQYSNTGGNLATVYSGGSAVLAPGRGRRDEEQPIEHYTPQGLSNKTYYNPIIGPYPHSDQDIEHRSWWFRTARRVTGDLGPIEHRGNMDAGDSGRMRSSTAADDGADSGHRFVSTSSLVESRRKEQEARNAEQQLQQQQQQPQQSQQHRRSSWFWGTRDSVDRATADAADALKRGADTAGDTMKRAVGDTYNWVRDADKAVNDAAANASRGMEQAADDAATWLQDRTKDVNDAAANASHDMERAADDTASWLQDRKKDVDDAATDAANALNKQASSARNSMDQAADDARAWMRDTQQEVEQATDDALSWWEGQKRDAKQATDAAAADVHGWATRAADDLGAQVADASQAIADAAGSVQQHASDAGVRAREAAASAAADSDSRRDNGPPPATGGNDGTPARRRDSLMEPKGGTVLQALDSTFDDARAALQSTGRDLRNMAENIPHPQATNEGLVDTDSQTAGASDGGGSGGARFVESDSGIPSISNGSR